VDERQEFRQLVAERVRRARRSRGVTMSDAAEASGVSHVTWRRIENAQTVKPGSYAAVDRFLGSPVGTTAFMVETGRLPPNEDGSLREMWDGDEIAEMQGDWDRDRVQAEFGRIVMEERERRQLSIDDAARIAGMPSPAWKRIEDGEDVGEEELAGVDRALTLRDGTAARSYFSAELVAFRDALDEPGNQPSMMVGSGDHAMKVSPNRVKNLDAGNRVATLRALLNNIAESIDAEHVDRVKYEMMLALLNETKIDMLPALGTMFSQLVKVRTFEYEKLNVESGTVSFTPADEPYDQVSNPWTEYVDGEFHLSLPASLIPESVRNEKLFDLEKHIDEIGKKIGND
jgi:transcriptional regulator with XRE-family HTH domain